MPQYQIVEPCIYTTASGEAVQHREAGAVVDLSDEAAADLGSAVKRVDGPALPAPAEHVEDAARSRAKRHGVTKEGPEVAASDG